MLYHKLKYLLSVIYILIFYTSGDAQNHFLLKGSIKDNSHKDALEYSTITLLNINDSSIVAGTVSNKQGIYQLPAIIKGNYLFNVSMIGYETFCMPLFIDKDTIYNVVLTENSQTIKDVTIMADRIKFKNNRYTINMVNNPIAQGKNVRDVIGFMPGVTKFDDIITVNGETVSEIYINGRIVTDDTELKGLQASDIARMEIISNDGGRLKADQGKAVIKIWLNKQSSGGYYGNIAGNFALGKRQSTESISAPFNYRKGKVNIYNYINLYHYNQPYITDVQTTYKLKNEQILSNAKNEYKRNRFSDVFSIVYDKDDKQNIGFTFNTRHRKSHENVLSDSQIAGEQNYESDYLLYGNRQEHQYQATMNYNAILDPKGSNLRIICDYLHKKDDYKDYRNYNYTAIYSNDTLQNNTNTLSDLWKITVDTKLKRWANAALSLGADYYSNYTTHDITYIKESDPQTAQDLSDKFHYKGYGSGVYADYTRQWDKWILNASFRVQNDKITIHDKENTEKNQSYWNIFPEANISYTLNSKKDVNISLFINRGMNSIRYSDMNPIRVYSSDFYYEKGNPNLKPVTWYRTGISLRANRRFNITYRFTFCNNDVFPVTFTDETNCDVTYKMPVNTGHSHSHKLAINYNQRIFKWWTTNSNLSGAITSQPYNEAKGSTQRLLFLSSNSFDLTSNNGLSLEFMWEKAMQVVETRYHSVYNLYLEYYQYLFNRHMSLTLSTSYLLHRSRILTVNNRIYTRQETNNSHINYFNLSLVWHFKGGEKIKGKKASSILNVQETSIGSR